MINVIIDTSKGVPSIKIDDSNDTIKVMATGIIDICIYDPGSPSSFTKYEHNDNERYTRIVLVMYT